MIEETGSRRTSWAPWRDDRGGERTGGRLSRLGVSGLAEGRGRSVRCLRQRIFTASKAGDLKKVRNLQKLMLRSRANALLSVRRVTEQNAGRKTAGIDGKVVVTAPGKAMLAERVRCLGTTGSAQPVKRVYIPKRTAGARSAFL